MFASSPRPPREGSGRRLEEPLHEPAPPPGRWVRPPSGSSLRSALYLLCCAGTACNSILSSKTGSKFKTFLIITLTLTHYGCLFMAGFMLSQRFFKSLIYYP